MGLGVDAGAGPGPGAGGGGGVGGVGGGGGSLSSKVKVVVVVVPVVGNTNCLTLKDNHRSAAKFELFSLAEDGDVNPPPVVYVSFSTPFVTRWI